MKIGIATPIHKKDSRYIEYNKRSVQDLEPKAYVHIVYYNDGSKGLKYYRTWLFDYLFSLGCSIVLNCSVDHYLCKNILNYVDKKEITTFAYVKYRISFIIDFIRFKLSPNMWTGCYSIPLDFWELLKKDGSFDGNDYSVIKFAEKINYPVKRIRKPLYILLNPSKSDPFSKIENYPLWKRIIRKIAWIDH